MRRGGQGEWRVKRNEFDAAKSARCSPPNLRSRLLGCLATPHPTRMPPKAVASPFYYSVLPHRDRHEVSNAVLLAKGRLGVDQRVPGHALPRQGLAYQHVAVPGQLGVVELHDLVEKELVLLVALAQELPAEGPVELGVGAHGQLEAWEEVREEEAEEPLVVLDELGQVHVPEGAHHDELLVEQRVRALQGARHVQHRLHEGGE